jgi:hypothetical protein
MLAEAEASMANVYQATLSDGTSYNVPTDKHHGNHSDAEFKKHLLDIIKNSTSGIITGVVVGYIFKGRK